VASPPIPEGNNERLYKHEGGGTGLSEIRSEKIMSRATPAEYEKIKKKAVIAQTTVSEYIRHVAIDGLIIKQDLSHFDAVVDALTRIENQIFMLSKKENINMSELKAIYYLLDDIFKILAESANTK
jgi:hypothetical protein